MTYPYTDAAGLVRYGPDFKHTDDVPEDLRRMSPAWVAEARRAYSRPRVYRLQPLAPCPEMDAWLAKCLSGRGG